MSFFPINNFRNVPFDSGFNIYTTHVNDVEIEPYSDNEILELYEYFSARIFARRILEKDVQWSSSFLSALMREMDRRDLKHEAQSS